MPVYLNFTKSSLKALKPTCKQYDVKDSKAANLFCRVNIGGSKTFMLLIKIKGKNVRITIGRTIDITVDQARKQASLLRIQVIQGLYLHEILKEKKQEPTFAELYTQYYEEHALLHTKRPGDNKDMLDLHIIPQIGNLKIGNITKQKIKEIHINMGEYSGKGQANRALDMTSAVFNYGIRQDIFTGKNPCTGIQRFKRKSRDRFLGKDELELFFDAIKLEKQLYQDFFLLLLYIGARKSTLLAMRFDELDFNLKRWRLSEEQSKNDEVNIYTLSDVALEILKKRCSDNKIAVIPSSFVFPGRGKSGHLSDPKKAFERIRKRMKVADIRIHDLRRTLASYMAINNSSLTIIGKALNHRSQASTEIYARLSQDPVREAVNSATLLMNTCTKKEVSEYGSYVFTAKCNFAGIME